MPLSPMQTTGHFDPPTGSSYAVIKVIQNSNVVAWGWTETTSTQNLRQEYWVLGPSYQNPINAQTSFNFDSYGFPGGAPTTRSAFFSQLAAVWGSTPGVQTCAGPATAMAALPTQALERTGPVAQQQTYGGIERSTGTSLQVQQGTCEIWSTSNSLVGWLYTDQSTGIESLVSVTSQVGPGLTLVLKPCQTQYSSPAQYFAAMTGYLENHGPPQRYESIANQWFPGVHSM